MAGAATEEAPGRYILDRQHFLRWSPGTGREWFREVCRWRSPCESLPPRRTGQALVRRPAQHHGSRKPKGCGSASAPPPRSVARSRAQRRTRLKSRTKIPLQAVTFTVQAIMPILADLRHPARPRLLRRLPRALGRLGAPVRRSGASLHAGLARGPRAAPLRAPWRLEMEARARSSTSPPPAFGTPRGAPGQGLRVPEPGRRPQPAARKAGRA